MIWGVSPAHPSNSPQPDSSNDLAGLPLSSLELESLRPALRRSAGAVLRRADDVDDAVQEAMLRLIRQAQHGSVTRSSLIGLACTTARRVALDMLARRQPVTMADWSDAAIQQSPPASLDAVHIQGRLRSAIDALPDPQRIAFLLVFQEGLSHADAARELRISNETLRSRLFRARCTLRVALKDLRS